MYIHNEQQTNPIDEKIELLQDFLILRRNDKRQEEAVRSILATCKSDIQMEQKLYNVLHGNETLQDLIKREMLFARQM